MPQFIPKKIVGLPQGKKKTSINLRKLERKYLNDVHFIP
jgi:hypothetical protein